MKGLKKKLKNSLKSKPSKGIWLIVKKIFYGIQFSEEIKLINAKHIPRSTKTSIIHFSLNKAATQYVKNILMAFGKKNQMSIMRLSDYAFNFDFPYLADLTTAESKQYHYLFKPQGYIYTVFGEAVIGIPDLENYKVILVIRDPRDILVSAYFSYGFSHMVPESSSGKQEKFLEKREWIKKVGIDAFVLKESDLVLATYNRYVNQLLKKYNHIYVTKYEDMVDDFDNWIKHLVDECGFNADDSILKKIILKNQKMRPKQEEAAKHLRKGKPGDYKEKLQPETINELNKKFASILEYFNYSR